MAQRSQRKFEVIMKNTVLIVFALLILSSCTKNNYGCGATDPKEPAINIRILDSEGNSLIGEDNLYKPSEITLTRGKQTIYLLFNENDNETSILLYFTEIVSGVDYQLKLNDQETDILKLDLKISESECFDVLYVEAFYLNGEEIQLDNDSFSYIIRK